MLCDEAAQVEQVPVGGAQPHRRQGVADFDLQAHAPIVAAPSRSSPPARWTSPSRSSLRDDPPPARRSSSAGPMRSASCSRPRAPSPLGRRWPGVRTSRSTAPRYARSDPRSGGLARDPDRGRRPRDGQPRATGHASQRGARARQIRAPNSIVACVQASARASEAAAASASASRLERGRSILTPKAANEPASHVRVDHTDGLRERQRGDRPRRVRPDAGEPLQPADIRRPAVALHRPPRPPATRGRAGCSRARSTRPARPRAAPRQLARCREACQEAREALGDPGRLRLLEHHLADQHGVRVVGSAPREGPVVGVVPRQQATPDGAQRPA